MSKQSNSNNGIEKRKTKKRRKQIVGDIMIQMTVGEK